MGRRIGDPIKHSKNQGNNLIEFSTQHLVTGIYFCKVEIGKKSYVKKFVKN